jgi:hypothetical protein
MVSPPQWVMFCNSMGLKEKVRDSVIIEVYLKPRTGAGTIHYFKSPTTYLPCQYSHSLLAV